MSPRHRAVGAEVLDACRRGDREGFRALYDAYKDRVYSIALYFFHGDRGSASDITQEVFVKLMTNMAGFRGDSGFSTWLYRLVVNACLDRARSGQNRERATDPASLDLLPGASSQEDALARMRTAESVQRAISALPTQYRLVILLRYFDDLSYEEMAAALNCSVGTISSRLNRGHRLLAERLASLKGTTV